MLIGLELCEVPTPTKSVRCLLAAMQHHVWVDVFQLLCTCIN